MRCHFAFELFQFLFQRVKKMESTKTEARTYLNARLPIEARVDDLLGRMTLEEKIDDIKEFRESLKLLDEIDEILPPNDSEPS